MNPKKPLLVLICQHEDTVKKLIESVDDSLWNVKVYPSIRAWRESLTTADLYKAVLVEFKVLINTREADRFWFQTIEGHMPVGKILIAIGANELSVQFTDKKASGIQPIRELLQEMFNKGEARYIRNHERVIKYMRAQIKENKESTSVIDCQVYDFSMHGVFVNIGTELKSIKINDRILIRFVDHLSETWLTGTVKWKLDWEKAMEHPPGIGIEFDDESKKALSKDGK